MKRTFDELRAIAAGAVGAIEKLADDLVVVVVVSESAGIPVGPYRDEKNGEIGRFACETNVKSGTDVARICRDVARAIEAL